MSCEIEPARRSQQCNNMQYHTIQCNYMYKTMQYHKTQLNSMQYHTMDAMQYNGIICIFGPKNSHFRQLGPYNGLPTSQTACRPAKRPPTGKPKVSGVTSGYLIFGPLFGPQRRQKFCFDPVAQRASGRPLQVLVPATVYLILTTVY